MYFHSTNKWMDVYFSFTSDACTCEMRMKQKQVETSLNCFENVLGLFRTDYHNVRARELTCSETKI